MQNTFIHLRNHTNYSLCQGTILIDDLIDKAKVEKMPAVGISDNQNLFGALEFCIAAKKQGIQPIIGVEASLMINSQKECFYSKVVLIAKNNTGYLNIISLISDSYKVKSDPYIELNDLKKYHEGIIILSGGKYGFISDLIKNKKLILCTSIVKELKEMFLEDFYIEISRHEEEYDEKLEKKFIKLAYDYNIPLVATNDNYFLSEDMHEAQDVLNCIRTGRYVSEEDRKKINSSHYFKSSKEMVSLFADIPEAIENTIVIAKKCSVMALEHEPTMPHFSTNDGLSEFQQLELSAKKGLQERIDNKFEIEAINDLSKQEEIIKEYFQRLNHELKIIHEMNFNGYFLIVSDFITWSKKNNIPVGPGRGSGAGSIVAWALQITDLDPIQFGLIFERFLNPERLSMPDFDIDFCQARRDEVINYVRDRYGRDMVSQIITFGKLQAKAVLRDVGRVLQIPYSQVDRICKTIPFNAIEATTLKKAIDMDQDLKNDITKDPQISKLIELSLKLEGLNRHVSTHAAGIIIGYKPLNQICPLYIDKNENSDSLPAISYSMKYAELSGLVKFDFLGLKTLTIISDTVKLIKETKDIDIDISKIRLDDKNTFKMLATGDSVGVFQIESGGMKSILKQMHADKIEDIMALISLYRPGPMDNIPSYIKRKLGKEEILYPHELLEPILKETYGVVVYQEQVMEIAKVLSGYSLGEADILRRAMGKKIKSEMNKQRKIFIEGAINNNVPYQKAEEIFELASKFAGYGFNKSHAAAYALISYQTAYLKANFPIQFITASINSEIENNDKINLFLQLAKKYDIKILPVDVNSSKPYFSIEKIVN